MRKAAGVLVIAIVALSGVVNSAEEGAMEGVLVSAKRADVPITITVVTDKQGRYRFPSSKLAPGQYGLKIRAAGYDLEGPGTATVDPGHPATADLHLKKTADLPNQLTNTEWVMSMPGTEAQKRMLLDCTSCHTTSSSIRPGWPGTPTSARKSSASSISSSTSRGISGWG